jgi:hypothetical protein
MELRASIGCSLLLVSAHAATAPLTTTNQNPLLADVTLPAPLPASITSGVDALAVVNWASSAIIQSNSAKQLVVDGETRETRLHLTYGLNERLAVKLELPWYQIEAGSLDSFIDDWHSTFGLPDGDRRALPQDELRLFYRRDGADVVNRTRRTSGLGNLALSLGLQLHQSERSQVSGWAAVALPTASDDLYALAHDSTHVSLSVAAQHQLSDRWSTFGQTSATFVTGGSGLDSEPVVWSGHAGLEFALARSITLLAQVHGHTALTDESRLRGLGGAAVLTLGGRVATQSGWDFQLGVSEDIVVEASPDVVFVFGFGKHWD